jgi:hypothetical protein
MSTYEAVLTSVGVSKTSDAILNATDLVFSHIAFGDGGGASIVPVSSMTSLVNEVWRGTVLSAGRDPDNPAYVVVKVLVPSTVGPFTIREVGLFCSDGQMFAISAYPDAIKPSPSQGAQIEILFKFYIAVTIGATVIHLPEPNFVSLDRMSKPFLSVISATVLAPPSAPSNGDVYLVPAGATGAWTGQAGRLAQISDGTWFFAQVPIATILGVSDAQKYLRKVPTGYAAGILAPGSVGIVEIDPLIINVPNGLLQLDSFNKVPLAHLPTSASWRTTIDGETLAADGRYILQPGHTLTVPDIGQGKQFEILPGNGDWDTLTTIINYPAGWTLDATSSVNAAQLARVICDSSASKLTIYSSGSGSGSASSVVPTTSITFMLSPIAP